MKRIVGLVLVLMFGFQIASRANEGMWLPMFIERLNYEDMQKLGLKLTPEEIYSVNHSSMKDAIVMLNGGSCTAEVISKDGMLLTNHHCAYGVIQQNSTEEHNYLEDGFWAGNYGEELKADGMTASFLVRMEDVSEKINEALQDTMSEAERSQVIRQLSQTIKKEATEGTEYNASVKSFFGGNEFYLFVYKTYRDVRLVGAPPSSIGKFGGNTDNWMWPRHTGDFSLLRIYSDQEGEPADYDQKNVPLEPKYHLPLSVDGVEKGDFAMIMGYPGSTDRYLTSTGVEMAITKDQPARVKIRGKRLDVMKEHMDADKKVDIQYASKYAGVSNYYKYFIGQTEQIKNNDVIDKKKELEDEFQQWVNKKPARKAKYGDALKLINEGYKELEEYILPKTYFGEAVFGSEILLMGYYMSPMRGILEQKDPDPKQLNAQIQRVKKKAEDFYKDYDVATDKDVTAELLKIYYNDIDKDIMPEYFKKIVKRKGPNFHDVADYIFRKSMLSDTNELKDFLNKPKARKLDRDPAVRLAGAFLAKYRNEISAKTSQINAKIDRGNRLFIAGLREMNPDKKYYPNANSTMRLTYGQVLDYYPRDAVYYNYYTTLEGVMEKKDPTDDEFIVPDRMVNLYENKNYGRYAAKDGTMRVNFLTNNDITGGNSGSPVINGKGELIGCAFDGNWEAMSGDIFFEDEIQRTIVADIRYILFVIDKYAGASHLLKQMTIVKSKEETQKVTEPSIKEVKEAPKSQNNAERKK